MRVNKVNDHIAEVSHGRNDISTYFAEVDDIKKIEEEFIKKGFELLQSDLFNAVLAKSEVVQHGGFTDEYSVYTNIVILSLK